MMKLITIAMFSVIYAFFTFVIFIEFSLAEVKEGFVNIPSKSDKKWSPSNDFFGDESNYFIKNYDTSLNIIKGELFVEVLDEDSEMPKESFELIDDTVQFSAISRMNEANKSPEKMIDCQEGLLYKAYFTRFINIFLRDTGFGEYNIEDEIKTVTVDMTLSKQDLTILKNFGSDKDVSLESLETSFLSLFSSVKKHNTSEKTTDISPFLNHVILAVPLIAAVVGTMYAIIKFHFKKALIIFTVISVYVAVVSLDLLEQYEDISEQIILKRLEFGSLSDPPKECFKSKMSYLEKFYHHIFSDDTCGRFLQSRKSIWYQMDIGSALSKPIQVICLQIFSLLGKGTEKLIKPFADKCPWLFQGVLYPILSILLLPILIFSFCYFVFAIYSQRISLRMPFFSSSFEMENSSKSYALGVKQSKEALEDKHHSPHTNIYNQGGTILLANSSDFIRNQITGMDPQNIISQKLIEVSGNVKQLLNKNGYKENGMATTKHIHGPSWQSHCIETPVLEGGSTSSKTENLVINNENKSSFFQYSSHRSTNKPSAIFNVLGKGERLRRMKNKAFKRLPPISSKWGNVTDETIKELFKPHVTK